MKALIALIGLGIMNAQAARDYIYIVGSSTVYPFATVVAEHFGKKTHYKTPKIESTGSGGGMKLFCQGIGVQHPDITNASRRIKKSEYERCQSNGVKNILEIKIGYDGIALTNTKRSSRLSISRQQLFLALAKKVPDPSAPESGRLIDNPYRMWSDIDPKLPHYKIRVLGPPPTSGTRDAFAELAMEGGCQQFQWIKQLKIKAKKAKKAGNQSLAKQIKQRYKAICHGIREDGAYIEAGENDNLIVQKLLANPQSYGIFGYSYLEENEDRLQGALIDGVPPEFELIAEGTYPISRPLYFYVKKAHIGKIPGILDYLNEFSDEETWGDDGYLADRGLIPMPEEERAKYRQVIEKLIPLKM